MKALLALAVIAGCGDNLPPGVEVAHSGSRLKLAWYTYEGGARERVLTWYYDHDLNERCMPAAWSDGHRYCTPATDPAVYVNDTCTRALGRTPTTVPGAPYFATTFRIPTEPSPVRSRLFRRGAPTLPPSAIWQKTTTGCIGPMPPGEDVAYYELGEEVPLTRLVQLRQDDPRGDGAIAVIDEISDDGLRVPVALYHRATANLCTIDARPDADSITCEPAGTPRVSYFRDPACSEPVVNAAVDAPVPVLAALFDMATSCTRYYEVGNDVALTGLYLQNDLGCLAVAVPGGQRFLGVAGPAELPVLERVHGGSHRIERITRVGAGAQVQDPWMYDAVLDTDCGQLADMRCEPRTNIAAQPFFADPQCQTALQLALVPSGACDPPARFATDSGRYYPVLGAYAETIYVPSTGDTCGVFVPPVPFVAHALGPPLDPADLAAAELVIDP